MEDELIKYAKRFIGMPYIYRANGANGFDCASYVQEILKAFGLLQNPWRDYWSQAIHDELFSTKKPTDHIKVASVLTFGAGFHDISHISIAINSIYHIECGGGDSTTLTIEDARKRGAMVRIRPIDNRADLVQAFDLFR